MFEVRKGMLPVMHLAPKILIAVNYCGCRLAQCFGWAAPAYHKGEGLTLHHGACKHGLQCDRRRVGRFGVSVGTSNLGCVSGKGGHVCEELRKMMIDVCRLEEVRWRGQLGCW